MMIHIQASPVARGRARWKSIEEARQRISDTETYLISRHGFWFRPGARGYTAEINEAGTFNADQAKAYLDVENVSVVPISSAKEELIKELDALEDRLFRLKSTIGGLVA